MGIMVFVNCDRLIRAPRADRRSVETLRSCLRVVRRHHWILCALAWACIAASTQATMTKIRFQSDSADINDLGHHLNNTWRIDDIGLSGFVVTRATVSVGSISNWDSAGSPPVTNLTGSFVNVRYQSDSKWPVQAATADTPLASPTLRATDVDDALDSARNRVQTLAAYIAKGSDVASGLDPGHHFFNDGIKFAMTLTAVPEVEAIYPILSLFAAVVFTRILQRRRSAQSKATASAER